MNIETQAEIVRQNNCQIWLLSCLVFKNLLTHQPLRKSWSSEQQKSLPPNTELNLPTPTYSRKLSERGGMLLGFT